MTNIVNGTVSKRPSETVGAAAAIAALIAHLVGVNDPDTLTYLIVVVGFVPTAVTWLVNLIRRRNGNVDNA